MIPNQHKIITIPCDENKDLGIFLKTNYTESSVFDYFFPPAEIIEYPTVSKINHSSAAYKNGLRAGDTVLQLNNISLLQKDMKTIQADFAYEKDTSNYLYLIIK